ncbi:glycosyltransferase [Amycolatopsis anabasis]|uniref:glycosyltransferase n=1 Tax=Amycolatopsis anabasis TaxID=1840409 RepID=UPI00131DA424|nr:nucleotide disphospho-sugar-binding domain-containing protein [Amycolatopsis anabasis]
MNRFLFVVPPLTGHVNPLRAVAAELAARGHQVAWAGPAPLIGRLTGARTVYRAADAARFAVEKRPAGLRGFAALRYLWAEYLIPLADAMAEGVEHAIADFEPDAVVADQQALAGALAATRRGVPWATSATTSSELADPLKAMPKVAAWISALQADLRVRHGLPSTGPDLRFSPHLVLAFTTEALAGPTAVAPVRYVGPSLAEPSTVDDFPWDRLSPRRPLVLVTLGTANVDVGHRFLTECAQALDSLSGEVQGVIADPSGLLPNSAGAGAVVVRRIPQLALIRRAAVVVCHGGHNTVCESLGHGVPLVVAPIRDDQPILAEQVVTAGAGRRLRFDRAKSPEIATAVLDVLRSPEYAANARRIRDSFSAAGGAPVAADHLEKLPTIE